MIRFGLWSIILLVGALQGVVVSFGLFTRRVNRQANVFLAGLIFLLSLKLVPYVIGYAGFYVVYPWLDLAPFDLSLGFGPLLYLYVSRLTGGVLPPRWKAHLAPLAAQFLVYSVLFIQPLGFKDRFETSIGPTFNTLENLLVCLSFCVYLCLTWREANGYGKRLSDRFSNPELHRLKPLRLSLAVITTTFLAFVCAKLCTIFFLRLNYYQMFPFYVLLTGVVYLFGFVAFPFAQVEYVLPVAEAEPRAIDWESLAREYTAGLQTMAFWRDPFLSVASASKALGTTETRLSKAINLGLGVSFSTWINGHRIEEAANELCLAEESASVLEIAQRCGFNSKASFNRWFKAIKGCTPTEFRSARSASSPAAEPHPLQPQSPPS